MSAVVITGAAGDLGRALSASFLADGYTVLGADIAPIEPRQRLIPVALDVTDRAATVGARRACGRRARRLEHLDQRRRNRARRQSLGRRS